MMIEKNYKIIPDALLKVRKGIDIEDRESFKSLGYVACKELTKEQLDKLKILNNYLTDYEKEIKIQIENMISYAQKKVNNHKDWIDELDELEVVINFFLSENDPCYEEDEDNILITMTDSFFADREIYGIADGVNHNKYAHWDEKLMKDGIKHPMYGEYHCWIFHGLYDHTQLHWEEILRIGSLDVDFKLKMGSGYREISKIYK